ncbi:MAG: hypothetical protein Q8L27_04670, partial [archaeon]|nr:hypothetical protein [archaeon]
MKIFYKIKKIAGSLIIASIILLPFSDIKAQTPVNFGTSGSGGSGSASLSGYIKGLAPAIAQFPGCKSAIKSLFKGGAEDTSAGIKSVIGGVSSGTRGGSDEGLGEMEGVTNLSNLGMSASSAVLSVPVHDPAVDAVKEDTTKILQKAKSIEKSTSNVDKNQNCLNAIGKAVVKLLIQNMTLSIVNWIQTGNSGGPFFVQNPSKFFADIAKNQILDFGLEISDSGKYPFGRSFMENVAIGFNNKFQDNAQYSLDQMIQSTNPGYSAAGFSADFSQGGWSAWNAMVQVPANNPLGFNVMASNELNTRLAGTTQSVAQNVRDSLQQASGFFGDERCTDPAVGSFGIPITREEDEAAKKEDTFQEQNKNNPDYDQTVLQENSYTRCKKWEYVTPGAVIGNTLTKNMNNNDNSLVSAETLNDAIAAILDATLARFSSELTNTGLAYMSTSNELSFEQTDLGDMFQNLDSGTYSENMFQTPWIKNHPGFDIKTGVTQALVDEQRTYVEKINLYNDTLNDLIKWIRQLDYCIPGPNPDWETATLNATQNLSGINLTSGAWPEMGNITWEQMSQYDPT